MSPALDIENAQAESPSRSPSIFHTLTELPRSLFEVSSLAMSMPLLSTLKRGDGHPVMVLPGFMAGDQSTLVLRKYLKRQNFDAYGWDLGRNTGRIELIEDQLPSQIESLFERSGEKITLIGQSLGGVFAREIARRFPEKVRQVITLGSPIALSDSHRVNQLVSQLFEKSSGLDVEQMRARVGISLGKPNIPMTAIYSRGDGIVHWQGCKEANVDEQTQNIEVYGSHCGMAHNPVIFRIIADRLSQKESEWNKFDTSRLGCLLP